MSKKNYTRPEEGILDTSFFKKKEKFSCLPISRIQRRLKGKL
jgi:hypothetical protein